MLSIFQLGVMVFLVLGFVSCKEVSEEEVKQKVEINAHGGHGHTHDFACPMHADMRGHEGEKCNVCGMLFKKIKETSKTNQYSLAFYASETEILADTPVRLFFNPQNLTQPTLSVPLDVTHEKKIHLFVVNESLSWFNHIHPEYISDGSYVIETTFPSAGRYSLFANYRPSGQSEQQEYIELLVTGEKDAIGKFEPVKTIGQSGKLEVELLPKDPSFYAQSEIHFDGILKKSGVEYDANELHHYLGAVGHLVAIHVETKSLIHIHSEIENKKLHFHTVFPLEGTYRMWLQFRDEDQIHTVDYTIDVKAQPNGSHQNPD